MNLANCNDLHIEVEDPVPGYRRGVAEEAAVAQERGGLLREEAEVAAAGELPAAETGTVEFNTAAVEYLTLHL